jgi:hypothetical protein
MKKKPRDGLAEILAAGRAPGVIVEDRGAGWVDSQAPRWWGRGTKNGPFARQHTRDGKPIWSSCEEAREAVKKANAAGDRVQAIRPRDYE